MAKKVKNTRKLKITRQEQEKLHPKQQKYGSGYVWTDGEHIAYNSGTLGWNWDLILYRGEYYVAGYRNFPRGVQKEMNRIYNM